ncbi:MAG: DNA polymerase III subunit beta [Gammaproteobacteria bacterium]|nr:DNA polymerase III subunit beta [Gammaproteobacteria bacterium]MDH5629057.1 DNA polymerase III subunit beta [Gammaproteobacteria bacterium]
MKFTVSQENLLSPLQLVSGAVEKKQSLPVLSNILLQVNNGQLKITATDLELEMSVTVSLDGVSENGETTVPARKFFDICRSLSDTHPIDVTLEDNRLKMKSGRNKFSLSTISANEFPNLEESEFNYQFDINAGLLKELIEKTQFAMAHQDVRYYLNGLLIEINGDNFLTVATDGHRLALSKAELNNKVSEQLVQSIIPRKGVLEILKLLSSSNDECRLEIGSNHVRLTSGDYLFTSKLIDGRFPDYDKVIPKNSERLLLADKETLKDAFARASILCNEKFKGVRLNLNNDQLVIHANNPEQEEAEIEVDVSYSAGDLEIGFNVGYLMDSLNAIRTEKVKFNLGDSNSSVLIESADNHDSLYVVMPMRL